VSKIISGTCSSKGVAMTARLAVGATITIPNVDIVMTDGTTDAIINGSINNITIGAIGTAQKIGSNVIITITVSQNFIITNSVDLIFSNFVLIGSFGNVTAVPSSSGNYGTNGMSSITYGTVNIPIGSTEYKNFMVGLSIISITASLITFAPVITNVI
jgi:hypothetical protein